MVTINKTVDKLGLLMDRQKYIGEGKIKQINGFRRSKKDGHFV